MPIWAVAAHAEAILIRADIVSATVYLSGADVTRRAEISVPAGKPPAAHTRCQTPRGPTQLALSAAGRAEPRPVRMDQRLQDRRRHAGRSSAGRGPRRAGNRREEGAARRRGRAEHRGRRHSRPRDADGLPHRADAGRVGMGRRCRPIPHFVPQLVATLGAETARVQAEPTPRGFRAPGNSPRSSRKRQNSR